MKKALFLILPAVLLFSGCQHGTVQVGTKTSSGLIKSNDGGKTWEVKNMVEAETETRIAESLVLAINPSNSNNVYLGTRTMGIYSTNNGADSWSKLDFPPVKTYGIAISSTNPQDVYATGVWQNRGKIYKSEDGAQTWKEIYTEPADGTVVISLAISNQNPQKVLAGTSAGAVIMTKDGGNQWSNVFRADGPVTSIEFAHGNEEVVYFGVRGKGLLRSDDGGQSGRQIDVQAFNVRGVQTPVTDIHAIAADATFTDVVYLGTSSGLLRGVDYGDRWETLNILSNPERFPVRAIAVNPTNPHEIIYSAAQAIYKSADGGKKWSTFQLDTANVVKILQYDPANPSVIYGGVGPAR